MAENEIQKFKVVFKGDIEPDRDISEVKANLIKIFNTTPDKIEKLFSGKKLTLNNNLDEISAQNYVSELLTAGVICTIEPMPLQRSAQQTLTERTSISSQEPKSENTQQDSKISIVKNIEALKSKIAPTLFPKLYIAGWIFSALGMAFLYCLYILIILFFLSSLYDHLIDNITFIDDIPYGLGVIAYLLPIVICIFFISAMIKPFFAPPTIKKFSIPLSRKREPTLFIFIEKLCQSIGPKPPSEIEIDFSIGATASYKYGVISFLEDKLTVSIGLPIIGEMTIGEFAGMLSHEFAHFTEKMTTRLYYVITNVNAWFTKVVYTEDIIDNKLSILEGTATKLFIRLPITILRFFVWLTRKIAYVFLVAGHIISRYYVRQMEFEADKYAVKLTGKEAFESALYKTHIITKAMDGAFQKMKKLKNRNDTSLPNNFVELISAIIKEMSEEEIAHAKTNILHSKTKLFESHPTDKERIDKIKTNMAKGLFQSDRPVATLFSNFDEIVKLASARFYRESLGLRFDQTSLIPTQDFLMTPEPDQDIDITKPESRFM